jgi:hypothetical protein
MSNQIKANDFVRIVKQPQNQIVQIANLKGYVEEVEEAKGIQYARFKELKAGGQTGGCGSVPVDCLEPLTGSELMQVKKWKQLYDDYIDNLLKDSQNFTSHCLSLKDKALEKVAAYVGLTEEQALSAFTVFEEYQKEIEQASYEYQMGRKTWGLNG